jgi:DNA-directed RNA polymerase subunit RPC12/RpoP
MAAKKRESSKIEYVYECIKCKTKFNVIKKITLEGSNCPICTGALIPNSVIGIDYSSNKDFTVSQIKVDIDIADALKGLKAVTRAAKKATNALKELDEQQLKLAGSKEIALNMDGREIATVTTGSVDGWKTFDYVDKKTD